ncbi:TetR/AcrR family transcriptional regulator [Nocardia sp. CA2R105]|uniref:TetR/AcrR family transcriptional regulator n=1 Tax=Nocardia coffeae TaxID=2873381 RepID=UPI001CA759D3|nr:TetR/AcrR family transcriptional regulator [Nocardia coffeae]MBY8857188.1 TetR/AcrR family transcriptional regulator [Nocardia coffeae]
MRTHGWAGATPASDEEAIARILRAAGEVIDAGGQDLSILKVAERLGVTRQTVYRYFPGTDALLQATATNATGELLDELAEALRGITDPADAVVEGIALTLERLHSHKRFGLLFAAPGHGRFAPEVTSEIALRTGRHILDRFDIDWTGLGWGDRDLDELAEHMLRTLQSFIIDPGHPPRSAPDLRAYLHRWVAPHVTPTQPHHG